MIEQIENLICSFLATKNIEFIPLIMGFFRNRGLYNITKIVGDYFITKEFTAHSRLRFLDEYSIALYYTDNKIESFDKVIELLQSGYLLSEQDIKRYLYNISFTIPLIKNRYISYPIEIIYKILTKPKTKYPFITLTMTTCKRLDLFVKTMASFLNCCTDINLVDRFLVVDDNSSQEDRDKMKEMFPFIDFYFKTIEEKGHPQSMNIILNETKDSAYIFHMEDDWQFFIKRNYLTNCLEVLNNNNNIGQCCLNVNYAETEKDIDCVGGLFKRTVRGMPYYLHEHTSNQDETNIFNSKYPGKKNCAYWPHYSLRPSLIRRDVLAKIGDYNNVVSHFEMEYAGRYQKSGFVTAFLEGIFCYHIGRLTSERNDKTKMNAYDLNGEAQFSGKEEKKEEKKDREQYKDQYEKLDKSNLSIKGYLVNLDKRSDRMDRMKSLYANILSELNIERFSAIDGSLIPYSHQFQRLCYPNDFGWRNGMIGCAYSHIKIWIKALEDKEDFILVLEDDIDFCNNFVFKIKGLISLLFSVRSIDLVYIGHSQRKQLEFDPDIPLSKIIYANLTKQEIFDLSLGGTFGYIIRKSSIPKLLDYIDNKGLTNGIDWVMMNASEVLSTSYININLVNTEAYRGNNNPDSDIQYSYANLKASKKIILDKESEFFTSLGYNIIEIDNIFMITALEFFDPSVDIVKTSLEQVYNQAKNKLIVLYYDNEIKDNQTIKYKLSNDYNIYVSFPDTVTPQVIQKVMSGPEGRFIYNRIKKDNKYVLNI